MRISPSRANPSFRNGFTILEVLVVAAIIAVLVALATPTLITSRRMANTALCGARLRMVGSAVDAFCSDHNQHFPTTIGAGIRADNWVFWEQGRDMNQSALAHYLVARNDNFKSIFQCPSQSLDDQVGYQNGGAYPLTYSMNYCVSRVPSPRLGQITSPQQKILVYDENQNADDDQFFYGTDRDTLAGRHGAVDYQSVNINGAGDTKQVRGLGNVLFLDGHVGLVDNNYCHVQQYNDFDAP